MNTKFVQNSTLRKKPIGGNDTYSNISPLVKTPVLGVGITNETTSNILEYIIKIITYSSKNMYIVTPNPEILLLARRNKDLLKVLNNADIALCDGMQLLRAARIMGIPLKERIIGTNFVEMLCEKVADWPITVGFLGAGPGVAEQASECLLREFPRLKVVFVAKEWSEDGFVNTIDILFVAFGFPKQELWMAEHVGKIPVRVMMGVGGAFDQIANPSLRPPDWVHTLGAGWAYRLIREPWRIWRQIKLVDFIWLVLKEKYFS